MKKIFSIAILLFSLAQVQAQTPATTACCPEFTIAFKKDFDCVKQGSCLSAGNGIDFTASMCKYSTDSFFVVPGLPGAYDYYWTITGSTTPGNATGNPVKITWGGGSTATIMVTITSKDSSCVKTIRESICLRDAPQAGFTFSPNGACSGTAILFNNTTVGGTSVYWDFGDGSFAGNVNNPTHAYTLPGTYNVTIYVTTDTAACHSSPTDGGNRPCCGCTSSFTTQVIVDSGSVLTITPQKCINQCLCTGDTSEYCVTPCGTSSYTWNVLGGTVISGGGTQCVKVKWTGTYPTTVSVTAGSGCTNPCGNTATLSVPVLVPNIPILPATPTVCANSTQTYSLPAMPGVFYTWVVSGGGIIGPSLNTPVITVVWGAGPNAGASVKCTYYNPLKPGCNGMRILPVNILPVLKISGPAQSCVGTLLCNANFTAFGSTVNWVSTPSGVSFTPNPGANTTAAFPVSATTVTYMITANGGAGFCNPSVSTFIVVAPKPALSVTPAKDTACPGTPVKFVATSTVKTTDITWILPSGATMMANTGPQLDTAVVQFSTTPATVTATQNCAFNLVCSQDTAFATVIKPPQPLLNAPVTDPCIDQSVVYSVLFPISGVNYTWTITNSLGTITSGQGTGSITVLWHGNNAVTPNNQGTLTVSNCGGSASATITVKVPMFPVITRSTGNCFPYTLTSSVVSGNLWSGPGVTGLTSQNVTITQPGTYTDTINSGMPGSCAQWASITIPPSLFFVRIVAPCIVSSCNLNALSVPLTAATNAPSPSCQWYFIPPLPASQTPVAVSGVAGTSCSNLTATQLGTYYLVVAYPTGCHDTSNRIRIPQDINICCASTACNSLPANVINFSNTNCNPVAFTGAFTLPAGWSNASPVTYCFGDGTSQSLPAPPFDTTHSYPAAGPYTACITRKLDTASKTIPGKRDTCCVSICKLVTVPFVERLTASYNCNTKVLTITDVSSYFPSSAGVTRTWAYTGTYTGTFVTGANQVIMPTSSGYIKLTLTKGSCSSSDSVLITIPSAAFTINPNPSCDGAVDSFKATASGMASYYWQFGDGSFSYLQNPVHIYPGPATSYMVTLIVVSPDGCRDTIRHSVNIQARPTATLSPNSVTICPGGSVTLNTAITATNGNIMCPNLSAYTVQWYHDGNPVGGPTTSGSFIATAYGIYFAVLTGTNAATCNCKITTNVDTVKWYPEPIARIKGSSTVCLTSSTGTVTLSNAVSGSWSANSANVTFSPATGANTTATISATGSYLIYLAVTDANGCKAFDTLCIFASNSPIVSVNAPGGPLCSGHVYFLQAVPAPPTATPAGYSYLWNTGVTTNTISVSAPGAYSVTIKDKNTGCSGVSATTLISQAPDLRLFPSCCDTICNNAPISIVPPLPLAFGQNACSQYTIAWLDNGVPVVPSSAVAPCNTLNTATLLPGLHNISIVVTRNGCTDTSDVFNLFIKNCTGCACSGDWKKITVSDGVKTKNVGCVNKPANKPLVWKCNIPLTINAEFSCAAAACPGSVSYTMTPPSGSPVSGNLPVTFTPTQQGSYTVVIYGMCGTKLCDSCVAVFNTDCTSDCCKRDIKISAEDQAYIPGTNATIATQAFSITGLTGVSLTEVRAEVISYDLGSNFDNECLGCKSLPFTWASIQKARNIGAVPPKITLFGTTTALFNPTAAPGIYQNPREVIWNSGSNFMIASPVVISFLLPPVPLIDCCELKGKICVKFTFRDDQCKECEVVVCFDVIIRKQ